MALKALSDCSTEEIAEELKRRRLIDASPEELEEALKQKQSKAWESGRGINPDPKTLDVDALLEDRPVVSPPVPCVAGDKTHTGVMRELTRKQIEETETYATGYIVKCNEKAGLPYEHINSMEVQERLSAEKDLRLIHAAFLNPDSKHPLPLWDLEWLRSHATGKEHLELMSQYQRWYEREKIKQAEASRPENFEELIEQVKKNDLGLWLSLDSVTLVDLLRTSAGLLTKSQIASVSGSS
jgi:hypothetical protein